MAKLPAAKKHFGQHFLIDQTVIDRITQQELEAIEVILEVGPGPGALTKNLLNRDLPFIVVERDPGMQQGLNELLNEKQILMGDALKLDRSDFPEEFQEKNLWFVSNLPYNTGVPIMRKFMEWENLQKMTVMLQKEVAEKIIGASESSSIACLMNNYFAVEKLCLVKPGSFRPPPKVDSMVINLQRRSNPAVAWNDLLGFESFLRCTFQFRRKQIVKNLSTGFSESKIRHALQLAGLTPQVRAHALEQNQLVALFKALKD